MSKPKVLLEQWFVAGNRLMGKAYNHPRFEDGTDVITSSLVVGVPIDEPVKGDVLETRNTLYELGDKVDGIR